MRTLQPVPQIKAPPNGVSPVARMISRVVSVGIAPEPTVNLPTPADQPRQFVHRAVPVAGLPVDGGHGTMFDNGLVARVRDVVKDGWVKWHLVGTRIDNIDVTATCAVFDFACHCGPHRRYARPPLELADEPLLLCQSQWQTAIAACKGARRWVRRP